MTCAKARPRLPLIAAMERGTAEQRQVVQEAIETGGVAELDRIVAIVKETGALTVTREAAAAEAQRAMEAARLLPPNRLQPGFATIGGSIAATPALTARGSGVTWQTGCSLAW